MLTRRSLLIAAAVSLIVPAPAIVRAASLMPMSVQYPRLDGAFADGLGMWFGYTLSERPPWADCHPIQDYRRGDVVKLGLVRPDGSQFHPHHVGLALEAYDRQRRLERKETPLG